MSTQQWIPVLWNLKNGGVLLIKIKFKSTNTKLGVKVEFFRTIESQQATHLKKN